MRKIKNDINYLKIIMIKFSFKKLTYSNQYIIELNEKRKMEKKINICFINLLILIFNYSY